ncbi:PAS domain-containing protein [Lacticaseibacillus sp. GG6-2]
MTEPDYDGTYVHFPTGRLTLTQVQQIFSTIPFEIDLIDNTNHFTWYSNKPNREHGRTVDELDETVAECHPPRVLPIVMKIINSFKDGTKDFVVRPLVMHGHRVFIQYYALRDVDGEYLGTIEFTGSAEPILQAYESGGWSDASSGASEADGTTGTASAPDATSGASESSAPAQPDATSGASETEATPTPDATSGASETEVAPAPDATSGASESSAPAEPDATTGASETGTDASKPGPFNYDL